MNYKKFLCGISALTVCFMLTGCHMNHEWQEATCTTPKTCSTGGETEGEALGHTWVEATCAEPKHCSVCGETEGEALAHTWVEATCAEPKHCSVCGTTEGNTLEHTLTEANYQQAATCEVCGETVGEPLQAAFEKYGLTCNAELNTEYTFDTPCYDPQYTTKGNYSFSDYEVFESDDKHKALEGYEWKAVTITMTFDDENASKYGFGPNNSSLLDYYDIAFFDNYNEKTDTYTVNYNGAEFSAVQIGVETLQSGWQTPDTDNEERMVAESKFIEKIRMFLRLPKGYDGVIVAFSPTRSTTEYEGSSAKAYEMAKEDGNTICFRLK